MTDVRQHEFTTLDALRGVAAIAVALYHFSRFYNIHIGFSNGYIAVDVFFVLSGFIIAHSYDHRLKTSLSVSKFIRLRFARLTPMIAIGAIIGVITEIITVNLNSSIYSFHSVLITSLLSVFNVPNIILNADALFPLNDPQWTLFYEVIVNIIYAVCIGVLTTRRVGLCVIATAFFWSFYVIRHGSADLGFAWSQAGGGLARVIIGFSIGVMLRRTYSTWSRRVPTVSPAWIFLLLITLLEAPIPATVQSAYDLGATLVIAPFIVALGSVSELAIHQRRTGQFLATISYPLYAIHYPFTRVLETYVPVAFQAMASLVLVAALVPGCWFLSRYVEKPAIALIRTLLIPRKVRGGSTPG